MSRYYGFSIDKINDMSMYQFNSYLNDIAELEKMFSGGKSTKKESISNKELINRAKKRGFMVPKHY